MGRRVGCAAGCILLCLAALPARAQQGGEGIYEELLRQQLDAQDPMAREIGVDAGGWFNFAFLHYNDVPGQQRRQLRQYQLRAWASVNIKKVHQAYVRGLLTYDDWDGHDNPISRRGDDFDGQVERAWYRFDLGRLIQQQTGSTPPMGVQVKVGRDFTTVGTALVLAMPLDHFRFDVEYNGLEFMAMLGKTLRDSTNIDDSPPVANRQDRNMYAFELAYSGLSHHRPFVYFLSQFDHTTPKPILATQAYDYSSRYMGVGSTGTLLVPELAYQTELAGQWGRTYSEGAIHQSQDDIRAMAFDLQLEYLFQVPTHPRAFFEYLHASGDSDRRASATSTFGGNLVGTDDHAFNAFGFRDTGIAFAPRISNLNMWVIGGRFFPLEAYDAFREMEVGTKVFLYDRDKRHGPISDATATGNDDFLGWEWDVYCNWRITSDLAWTMRYGAFMPSDAFRQRDAVRHFLYTGVSLSF